LIHPSFAKRAVASVTGGLVRKQLGQLREADLAKLDSSLRLWFGL
jgi:phage FluMu protein gp41